MSSHDDDVPSTRSLDAEGDRMERRLDELGDDIDDAKRKAKEMRQDDLPGDEPIETVAGDAAERQTSSDDPTSAVVDSEDDD